MLSGTGGDELLGQAFEPRVQIADALFHLKIGQFYKHLVQWSLAQREPALQLLTQSITLMLPTSVRAEISRQRPVAEWIRPSFVRRHKLRQRLLSAADGSAAWRPAARDASQTISNLRRQLTHFQPLAVERRYPFLDQSLVEFLTSVPTDQLIRPGERRSLMRRALSDLLPEEVLARRTKASTGRCVSLSFQKHWGLISAVLRSPESCHLDCIDHERLVAVLTQMKRGNLPLGFFHALRGLA